jgi:hypothetical protein
VWEPPAPRPNKTPREGFCFMGTAMIHRRGRGETASSTILTDCFDTTSRIESVNGNGLKQLKRPDPIATRTVRGDAAC